MISDVDDLRPPRLRGLRAVQGRLAGPALRRRLRGLRLVRVRIPCQALPLVTGLPAPLAVLAAAPARTAAGPAAPPSPRSAPSSSASPSRCCPSPAAAPAPPAAAPAAVPAPARPPAPPAARDLRVLRRHHGPQPRVGSAKPRSVIRHGLTGHASQAPTPAATPQIDKRRNQRAAARLKAQATVDASIKPRPREWTR